MPFEDRTTNLDLNGPDIEIKTQAYGHAPGSNTDKTVVNPFGADAGRTGGVIEITGIGTASWPVGYSILWWGNGWPRSGEPSEADCSTCL